MEKPIGMPVSPRALGETEPLSPSRRAFLAGAAVALVVAGCYGAMGANAVEAPAVAPADAAAFLRLSKALTGYEDLNPLTAARIAQAFGQLFPNLEAHFAALAALATGHAQPDELLAEATKQGLAEPALAIVAAWYKGTVGQGSSAISVAYAEALMNRPVADALYPPTYQLGGPGWWIAEPPPVGLSPPVERHPAAAPATEAKQR